MKFSGLFVGLLLNVIFAYSSEAKNAKAFNLGKHSVCDGVKIPSKSENIYYAAISAQLFEEHNHCNDYVVAMVADSKSKSNYKMVKALIRDKCIDCSPTSIKLTKDALKDIKGTSKKDSMNVYWAIYSKEGKLIHGPFFPVISKNEELALLKASGEKRMSDVLQKFNKKASSMIKNNKNHLNKFPWDDKKENKPVTKATTTKVIKTKSVITKATKTPVTKTRVLIGNAPKPTLITKIKSSTKINGNKTDVHDTNTITKTVANKPKVVVNTTTAAAPVATSAAAPVAAPMIDDDFDVNAAPIESDSTPTGVPLTANIEDTDEKETDSENSSNVVTSAILVSVAAGATLLFVRRKVNLSDFNNFSDEIYYNNSNNTSNNSRHIADEIYAKTSNGQQIKLQIPYNDFNDIAHIQIFSPDKKEPNLDIYNVHRERAKVMASCNNDCPSPMPMPVEAPAPQPYSQAPAPQSINDVMLDYYEEEEALPPPEMTAQPKTNCVYEGITFTSRINDNPDLIEYEGDDEQEIYNSVPKVNSDVNLTYEVPTDLLIEFDNDEEN